MTQHSNFFILVGQLLTSLMGLGGRMKLSRFPLRMAERRGLLVAADLVLTCGAVLVAFLVWALKAHRPFELDFVLREYHWFPVLTFLWFVSALLNDLYNLKVASKPQETASALLRTSLLVLAVYLVFYFFSPPRKLLPRGIVLYHAAASFVLVGLWRMGYIFLLTRPGFRRRAIVIGAGKAGREIVRAIQENISSGYHIVGFVDDDPAKQGLTIEGVKVIGTRYDLVRLVKEESVSELILAITWDIHDDLTKAIMDCQERGVQITPMFLLYEEITGRVPVGHIGHNWTLALPTDHASTGNFFPLFKRTFDIIVSAAGLVVLGALFPFLALAIYIDSPGPIFYTQRRVGRGGKVFRLFKLRSMVPDAERDGRPVWASEKDKRVTRVGRFLRGHEHSRPEAGAPRVRRRTRKARAVLSPPPCGQARDGGLGPHKPRILEFC